MNTILNSIFQTSAKTPKAVAIIEQDKQLNYLQLHNFIEKLSDELASLKASAVAIYMDNNSSWIISDLAAANIGLTVVPIPLFFTKAQITHLLSDANIDVIITCQDMLNQLSIKPKSVSVSDVIDITYVNLTNKDANTRLQDVSKITYTSGSTGNPKGVCLSGDTIESVVLSLATQLTSAGIQRHLSLLPFATLLENIAGVYLPLFMGNAVITGSVNDFGLKSNHQFCAQTFINANKKWQANSVILLPQMLKAIAEQKQPQHLSSFTFMAVGGGKVSSDLIEQCHTQKLPIYEGYGLSECASVVSLNTPIAHKVGSVGKPLPHVKLAINSSGELIVKGSKMQGYLNDTQINHDHIENIATGDIAYIDEDGFLFITGRSKNLLISSFGRNISPEWVESSFLISDKIQQIFVYGDAQPYLSAVVVPSKNSTIESVNQVIAKVNSSLPDYAQVQSFIIENNIFSVENGLLTENGKLRRDKLTQIYKYTLSPLEAVI